MAGEEDAAAAARREQEAATVAAASHKQEAAQALALSEAATIASLHAQAYGVLNIKALVPIVLDLTSPSYNKWRGLFLVTLGKYADADQPQDEIKSVGFPIFHGGNSRTNMWSTNYRMQFALG